MERTMAGKSLSARIAELEEELEREQDEAAFWEGEYHALKKRYSEYVERVRGLVGDRDEEDEED